MATFPNLIGAAERGETPDFLGDGASSSESLEESATIEKLFVSCLNFSRRCWCRLSSSHALFQLEVLFTCIIETKNVISDAISWNGFKLTKEGSEIIKPHFARPVVEEKFYVQFLDTFQFLIMDPSKFSHPPENFLKLELSCNSSPLNIIFLKSLFQKLLNFSDYDTLHLLKFTTMLIDDISSTLVRHLPSRLIILSKFNFYFSLVLSGNFLK